ncbi:ABC transporter ATP-binding protein [Micromonospora tulbaghiae]|uniref:ABC transporter ATP-binding protein n=1 Tax=Micromonospora tulbaghiae TaxID=479978 RepID=A0AAW4JGV4_9ACTN|nr:MULTISPECIES: ABC transporter ATP-binding protein [Micromonospora]KAB1908388.1 ABC transporter ATP-binding protein [Micromonospora sp. AMSO1212t]MBO4141516.1 ABC transporter ATP-binding protein [Micromonospora tulbaghiae]MDX5459086.1 ABC transporter ATP-binding protein [Micromonospora tulbaghiae]SCF10821.1 peptide/nickel transport system ATP-binding protein [Micromonospora tulbaghiae]
MSHTTVLSVDDLTVTVGTRRGPVRAVAGVSWQVRPGETFALVGESGSGKSMTLLAATGLAPRAATVTGRVRLLDTELTALPDDRRRKVRGRHVGFVFQDPMTSLNPVLPVGRQVTEAAEEHLGLTRRAARDRAVELLELVGIPSAARRVDAYPHQFSGGMRQRVAIAMALACEPDLLIADEPTTALDVTTQAQIIELVADLQARLGTAVVWVTHDLGVVAGIADTVAVMYGGRIVEQGPVDAVFDAPTHPYTRALLAARPDPSRRGEDLVAIPGSPPSPLDLPPGCAFWPRCPVRADPRCEHELPPLTTVGDGHTVRTFYRGEAG